LARILIIDDEPGVRITLKTMLQVEGHEILLAENGTEGMEVIKENIGELDLVITDILMPDMDGIQIINETKALNANLPVVAISGGGNRLDADDPLVMATETASGIIRKPFNTKELNDVVNKFLS